ncbi:hypothetical protein [Methylorubrum thiocyanatum]|uniref:Uncharacterized protein n=1 Tax=Methylorubrum thiocyanatum TaxID=47958 RepID=A0AA40S3P1_9HYPH|nr:hypothetical protein [Methylorubrum thiocyanatum]MBA8913971.1 hypothetical protein [Methylorubrum thiocyanatum]
MESLFAEPYRRRPASIGAKRSRRTIVEDEAGARRPSSSFRNRHRDARDVPEEKCQFRLTAYLVFGMPDPSQQDRPFPERPVRAGRRRERRETRPAPTPSGPAPDNSIRTERENAA